MPMPLGRGGQTELGHWNLPGISIILPEIAESNQTFWNRWGTVNYRRSEALKMLVWSKHICVFLVHVFHEAFYFQTLLKVIPGHRVLSAEIWSRFQFSKE
jgi:hypothetical protein